MLSHVCWEPELWSQQRRPLLRNGSVNTSVARQWLSGCHVTMAVLTRNNGTHHAASSDTSPVARWWCSKHPSVPAVTSCNYRRTIGSGVFCWVHPEALSWGPMGRAEQPWNCRLSCEISKSQLGPESWNTEAEGSAAVGMLAGDSRQRHSRLRRLSMCCSEL
jgi:hypothetical protein